MPRLRTVDPEKAEGPAKEMLDGIRKKTGKVPNIFRGMANSPAALGVYLGMSGPLSGANLPIRTRELIALAVAEANRCDYCLAAHTAIGTGMAGLTPTEVLDARRGRASDPKEAAAVSLARKFTTARADITDADVKAAREAGLDDAELAEVVAVTALNFYTNAFNHLNRTEVDFPAVPKL